MAGIRAINNSKQKIMKARLICQESSSERSRLDEHGVLYRSNDTDIHVWNDLFGSEMENRVRDEVFIYIGFIQNDVSPTADFWP